MSTPCRECAERTAACHATCEKYKAFQQARARDAAVRDAAKKSDADWGEVRWGKKRGMCE